MCGKLIQISILPLQDKCGREAPDQSSKGDHILQVIRNFYSLGGWGACHQVFQAT